MGKTPIKTPTNSHPMNICFIGCFFVRNFASSNKTNDERKISVHSVCAIFDLLEQTNEERLSGYRNKKERVS